MDLQIGTQIQINSLKAENEKLRRLLEESYKVSMAEFLETRDNDEPIPVIVERFWKEYCIHHKI